MNFENCVQVNSNFFFCKQFQFYNNPAKNKFSVNPKKITQTQFNKLMEHVVFKKGFFTHIKTSVGEFMFYGATHDFKPKQIQNILANQSKFNPTYYFRNVDYFSYGEFGYAEDGKIVRYLKFNSEAQNDENVVEWIGKPHTWEYETHTFYTKQKLETFEMSFDSDCVCDMVYFYLPFLKGDVKVENITVYSNQDNLNKIIKGVLNDKPYENLLEFSSNHHAKIVKTLIANNIESAGTTILVFKDKLVFNNILLNVTHFNQADPNNSKIISDESYATIPTKNLTFNTFHNILLKLICAYANAKQINYPSAFEKLKKFKLNGNNFQTAVILDFFEQDKKISTYFAISKFYNTDKGFYTNQYNHTKMVGKNINTKTIKNIYKEIIKLQKAL